MAVTEPTLSGEGFRESTSNVSRRSAVGPLLDVQDGLQSRQY
jgi:hypothetical protein